jgi:putative zinc finger protein
MTHVTEEQLIAFVLDDVEAADRDRIQAHLAECEPCRAEAAALRATLEAASAQPVPERDDRYGAQVWARLEPKLGKAAPSRTSAIAWRGWLAAAVVLLAVGGAFLAGRLSHNTQAPTVAHATLDTGAIRERVVLAALGDHLDRTERALTEFVNAGDGDHVDISAEQAWARDLLDANRLYRQSARGAASPALSQLLDELEPVLLDIVHSPSQLSAEEFQALRSRIEDRSLVFKLRVTGADVRARQKTLVPSGEKTS